MRQNYSFYIISTYKKLSFMQKEWFFTFFPLLTIIRIHCRKFKHFRDTNGWPWLKDSIGLACDVKEIKINSLNIFCIIETYLFHIKSIIWIPLQIKYEIHQTKFNTGLKWVIASKKVLNINLIMLLIWKSLYTYFFCVFCMIDGPPHQFTNLRSVCRKCS